MRKFAYGWYGLGGKWDGKLEVLLYLV